MAVSAKLKGSGTLIVTVAALTILAAIGGGLAGKLIAGKVHAQFAPAPVQEAARTLPYPADMALHELPAIVTNLAGSKDTHIRLQAAIIYKKAAVELPTILAAEIGDDIIAYLKTMTLPQLEGASGLQALREDLNDRATTRSNGKVRELMIENLVVQ